VETGEVWQVDEGVVGGLAWMPDGERLVFSKEPPFAGDIYVVDVDGGNLIQLTETTGRPHRVLGVLDDGRIMFSSSR
jgi:Tol biopolymer transport system component